MIPNLHLIFSEDCSNLKFIFTLVMSILDTLFIVWTNITYCAFLYDIRGCFLLKISWNKDPFLGNENKSKISPIPQAPNGRSKCIVSKFLLAPWGGSKVASRAANWTLSQIWSDKLSSEPFLAPDYRRFRAPRDLIFYKHTQNPPDYMVEANA